MTETVQKLYALDNFELRPVPGHEGGRNLVYICSLNGEKKYVLRISALGDRTEEDYLAETEFIRYLARNGAPVADVIPSARGKLVERIEQDGTIAYIALFEYAKGMLLSDNGYRYREGAPLEEYFHHTGKALGTIHRLSKQYRPVHRRGTFSDKYTEEYIDGLIPDSYADLKRAICRRLEEYRTLSKDPEYFGLIHFDFTDGNYHVDFETGDITVSMRAQDHLKMPELVTSDWKVKMSGSERKIYDDMKKDLVLSLPGGEVTAANAASLTGKLSQLANGAVYNDAGKTTRIHDRKLEALEDIIEARGGKPVLLAYWFRHDLGRIMERLSEKKIPFERIDTEESIRRWNAGLIHPASAGHGLNLQGNREANCIVWFSIPWSLELYTQTIDRLYRQGQQSETVIVEHIVTEGTIDERILKALKAKDMTQSALINAVKADIGGVR